MAPPKKPPRASKAKPPAKTPKRPPAKTPKTVAKTANAAPASARTRDDGVRQQFLASILANHDDKKARLVYGDLLQEAGDPRGELIAMQCARVELGEGDARIAEVDARIEELLKKHKRAWTSACGENKGARYEYRRGFVEKLSLDAADLWKNADRIFAAEPIEELNIWKIDESPTKRGNSRLAPILELPLHRIRRLSLARCKLTSDDFAALAEARTLGCVEVLDLTNGGSDSISVSPLAQATSLPKLRELIFRGCMMGDQAIAALARSETLRMQKLVLARNDFTGAAGEAIANAEWAHGLVCLDLSSNEMFGDAGLRALANSTALGALRTLLLEFTGIYEEAVPIIASSPLFKQLDLLDISATAVDIRELQPMLGDRVRYGRGV
jgi:uncharacterized protein (TIGR02996 family)